MDEAPRPAALLLALGLLGLPAAPLVGGAPGPWVIEDEQVVEGTPFVLATDVVVRAGGALRLLGADVTALGAPGRPLGITVEAGGLLELADGLSLATGLPRRTSLASPLGALTLVVEAGGRLVATNASIRDTLIDVRGGDVGIVSGSLELVAGPLHVEAGAVVLQGTVLDGSEVSAHPLLRIDGGALRLEQGSLRQMGGPAAVVRGVGSLVARDTVFDGPLGYAFDVTGGAVTLERVAVFDATDYGLYAADAIVAVRDSLWSTECGVFLTAGVTGEVVGNTFHVTGRGVSLSGTGPVRVSRNLIEGASEAVRVRGPAGPLAFDNNTFQDSWRGMTVADAQVGSRDDRFLGNVRGLEVLAGGSASVTLRGAVFEGNEEYAVWNDLPDPVDARWSWWGSTDGPGPSGSGGIVGGSVLVEPWLAAPP